MKIKIIYLFLLLIVLVSLASVEAKKSKKKKNAVAIKMPKKHKKSKKAKKESVAVTTESVASAAIVPTSVAEVIKAKVETKTSMISKIIESVRAEKTAATKTKKTNLRLVYKSVLPPGQMRPKDNLVFQYTDNEEGKTCRCICRIR